MPSSSIPLPSLRPLLIHPSPTSSSPPHPPLFRLPIPSFSPPPIPPHPLLPVPPSTMEKERNPSSTTSAFRTSSVWKEELLCPICYEPFREAVTLCCGHNFCKVCVTRSWENRHHVCPMCKERSSLADLRINHTLNNLVEMILKEEGEKRALSKAQCPLHHEEPKFFCLEDKELTCFACQSSKEHEGHKIKTVQDAAADFRAKLMNMETSLRDKAKDFSSVRRSYESIAKHNQVEAVQLENQVKKEFEKLHQFLYAEEKAMMSQLHEEIQSKQDFIQGKVEQLERDTQALLNEATQLQEDLREDDYTFLMTHKNRKRRIACTAEEPEAVPSGMLLNVAKYLGSLQYDIWKKMLDTITV
ncbi:PREDICTED: tripartite motif-containing protein 35-like, partial [Acanthisitta chloris]|uniref:tripartite motif-containing protein 35-like n=1 Tax=Acanthisitta chloris TaxID=57068 RepID=UPI0004F0F74D